MWICSAPESPVKVSKGPPTAWDPPCNQAHGPKSFSLTSWFSHHCLDFLSLPAFCNHCHHSLSLGSNCATPFLKVWNTASRSCLLAFALGILYTLKSLPKITQAAHSCTSFRFKGPEKPSLPAFLQTFPPSALEGKRLCRSKDSVRSEHGVQWCHSVRRQKLLVKPDKFVSDWPCGSWPFGHIAFS